MLKSILQVIGTVAVLGVLVYWLFLPTSTPSCDSEKIRDTLFRLSLKANIKNSMQRMRNPEGTASFHFHNPTELGYDKETGTRSCMASIYASIRDSDKDYAPSRDTGEKIGFTIERDPKDSDGFIVKTAPIEFLTARTASKDKNKTNKNLGAPIGRDAIQTAVVEGLHNIDKNLTARMPSYKNRRPGDNTPKTYAESVNNVLPTADCRELDEGRYGCPIQIEYRDNLLGAIGASPWKLLKGEFVFVREGKGWKVDDGFDKAFMEAVVRGRFGIDSAEDGR